MSLTLTIAGNKSILQSEFTSPLMLDGNYECGLLFFSTFNSIPNIHESNNVFAYGNNDVIKIPNGIYDLSALNEYIKSKMENCNIMIHPNNNTLKCSLFCTKPIDFRVKNSIGAMLGFSSTILEANKWHDSTHPVNIIPASVIRVECDLIQGSFTNGSPTHIIHEFVLNIPSGYQVIEVPKNVIYFPIKNKYISSVTLKILDLEGNLINFNNEKIQLRLHLRKRNDSLQ